MELACVLIGKKVINYKVMKSIKNLLVLVLVIGGVSVAQAQATDSVIGYQKGKKTKCVPDTFPAEKERVKWQKQCARKVFKPLSKAAARNQSGSLTYRESTCHGDEVTVRTVELNYISKVIPEILFASMRVNGDTTYYFTCDTLYVFDRQNRLVSVQSFFDRQWDYYVENTFLSFYLYSRFVPSGSAAHPMRCYTRNSRYISTCFAASTLSNELSRLMMPYHPGEHYYKLDRKQNALVNYAYVPVPELAEALGYTKIEYTLLNKASLDGGFTVPAEIAARNMRIRMR